MKTKAVHNKSKPRTKAAAPPRNQFVLLIRGHQLFPKKVFNVAFLPDGRHVFSSPEAAHEAAHEFLDRVGPFSERFRERGVVVHPARPGESFIDRPYAEIRDGVAVRANLEDA